MLLQMALFHYHYGWVTFYYNHIFFTHSSVDGHLGCFHGLAIIVDGAAMNIGMTVSFLN